MIFMLFWHYLQKIFGTINTHTYTQIFRIIILVLCSSFIVSMKRLTKNSNRSSLLSEENKFYHVSISPDSHEIREWFQNRSSVHCALWEMLSFIKRNFSQWFFNSGIYVYIYELWTYTKKKFYSLSYVHMPCWLFLEENRDALDIIKTTTCLYFRDIPFFSHSRFFCFIVDNVCTYYI